MIMAEALDYAHRMRTFHRDVKPGNVLLTLDHGPQLLDFNLAESPHSASQADAAMQGGTLPYMAPEQIEAFLNPQLWGQVGARADIYSLGLVLRELLTGQQPDLPTETISPQRAMLLLLDRRPRLDVAVSRLNPSIPHALEAILGKCLAFSADDRYLDARALVEDLRRFLDRRPLVHAVNPSRRERFVNRVLRLERRALRHRWPIVAATFVALIPALLASSVLNRNDPRAVPGSIRSAPAKPDGPLESSPVFQSAVNAIDRDEFLNAPKIPDAFVESMEDLVETYPESWQPKVYLSFVLSDRDPWRAEDLFRKALELAGANQQMLAWGKSHSRFAGQLDRFSLYRFKRSKDLIDYRPEVGLEEMQQIQREHYCFAKDALRIAIELEPEKWSIVKGLAISEQVMGEYRTAYERMERVIQRIRSDADRKYVDEAKSEKELKIQNELTESCYILCQIAIAWADHLVTQESVDAANEALRLLRPADSTTKRYLDLLKENNTPTGKDYRNWLEHQFLIAVALGEAEIRLGLLQDAEKTLAPARMNALIGEFEKHLAKDHLRIPPAIRVAKKRLSEAQRLLRLKKAVVAG